jgi:predicted AlkP superfamily pyrophosphatase or phosphodiesterase
MPTNIEATLVEKPAVSTLDVAPSILYAMDAGGKEVLIHEKANKVVLFYLDAFGYDRYMDVKRLGLVDNISSLGEPVKAACVYPSITQNNAKAMATGLAPNLTRADYRSYLPYNDTVLDILERKGLDAVWVDGNTAPVYVNDTILNPDTNGDGSQDDEVTAAAISEYRKGADFMVVHYKSTDSVMHDYGPYAPEGRASLEKADVEIGEILRCLDEGTVVIIYADHGCHNAIRGGNHGTLIPDDMYIPLIVGQV